MEQLTLEQHMATYINNYKKDLPMHHTWEDSLELAGKAGAEWQKEQYKHLLQIGRLLVDMCDNKLGVTFTSTQFRNALELIQD